MPAQENNFPSLYGLQTWFGKAISLPLPEVYPGNPLAISGPELAAEAGAWIRGKGGLEGFDRLGIYNQQYWFRLITIMQSDYTCAIHLMGLHPFNDWAVRYLLAHPPASPFLAELDGAFPAFLENGYQELNRESVLQAVRYERALSKAFDAADGLTLASAGITSPEKIPSALLILAPHLTALHLDWDFADFRSRCMPDESLEEIFELLPATANLVIFRNADLDVLKIPVPEAALAVLEAFQTPATLLEAFDKLSGDLSPESQAELEAGITGWFQDWVARGWLCLAEDANQT